MGKAMVANPALAGEIRPSGMKTGACGNVGQEAEGNGDRYVVVACNEAFKKVNSLPDDRRPSAPYFYPNWGGRRATGAFTHKATGMGSGALTGALFGPRLTFSFDIHQ